MNLHQGVDRRTRPDTWDTGDQYEVYMGRWSRLVAAEFIEWLDIPSGGVWLDVGCGTGALSAAICDMADPIAVTGVDPSPEFIEHAADILCADMGSFEVAEASSLPFVDDIFDVAVSGLVLNFVPDPVAALREQSRVVAPSGTIGAYVWDYAEGMRLLRHFWDAARRTVPWAAALDEAVRFPSASPAILSRSFEAVGLGAIETRAIEVELWYRQFDELWAPFLSGQGPAPGFVAGLDTAMRTKLRSAFEASLPVGPDGSITLTARAWAARGRV